MNKTGNCANEFDVIIETKPEYIADNIIKKILWEFTIQTNPLIQVLIERKQKKSVPLWNITKPTKENIEKYMELLI